MVEDQLHADTKADYLEKRESMVKQCEADFARFDTNGDGSLSKQECRESIMQLVGLMAMADPDASTDKFMAKYDLNSDGRITKDEYLTVMKKIFDEAVLAATDVMSGAKTHEEVMATLPEEARSQVEAAREGFLATQDAAFSAIDTNGDGFLDKTELSQMITTQFPLKAGQTEWLSREVDKFIRLADTDHNGKVSKAEFIEFNGRAFDAGVLG